MPPATQTLLITGSEGMLGRELRTALEAQGIPTQGLDLLAPPPERGDIRDAPTVRRALAACAGIIHLAAISRVAHAERDPELCDATNVEGLQTLLTSAAAAPAAPWVLFASSREVYGQPDRLPATEDTPLRPLNHYGRSKARGEQLIERARAAGLRAATVRLSNIYGSPHDHPDRVIPAFIRAALSRQPLHLYGPARTFDFTHIDDTLRGLLALVRLLSSPSPAPPPIHLLTGIETSLSDLAAHVVAATHETRGQLAHPAGPHEVTRFVGAPDRARHLLGWVAEVTLPVGLASTARRMSTPPTAPART